MRLIKKPETKQWIYNADSLEQFIQVIRDRANLARSACWEDSSISGGRAFTGTDSLNHAVDMLRTGWAEGARQIVKGCDDVAHGSGLPDLTPSYSWDIGGEFPDVGAFCAGDPEHMGSPLPFDNSVSSVVRIAVPGSIPADIPAQTIMRYGIALMSVIDGIQESGRSVALFWDMTANVRNGGGNVRTLHTVIPLTVPGAPVDVSRLAFAFHPSMLRRCWFAAVELQDDLKVLGSGYGGATDRRAPQDREHGTLYPRGPWGLDNDRQLGSVEQAIKALQKDIQEQLGGQVPAAA